MVGIFNPQPWRSQLRGECGGQGRWEGGGGVDGSDLVLVARKCMDLAGEAPAIR